MYFLKILKIDPPHGEVKGQNFTYFFYPKSRYGLSFGFGWSDVDKNWHSEANWPWEQAFSGVLKKMQIDPTPEGQSSKFQKNFWGQTFFSFFFVNFSCWKWLKLCIISLSGSTEQPTYVKLEIKSNWRVWIFSSDAPRANLTRNSCSLPYYYVKKVFKKKKFRLSSLDFQSSLRKRKTFFFSLRMLPLREKKVWGIFFRFVFSKS